MNLPNFFVQKQLADVFEFTSQCADLMNPTIFKLISGYGHVPMTYATVEGDATYKGTDTLWADLGNAHYNWMCEQRGYLKNTNLAAETKGDVLEVCFSLYVLNACYGVNLAKLFKIDTTYMSTWNLQWAMLNRDLYLASMAGLGDFRVTHPNCTAKSKNCRQRIHSVPNRNGLQILDISSTHAGQQVVRVFGSPPCFLLHTRLAFL